MKILAASDLSLVVVYPSPTVLREKVDRTVYAGRPFSLRLALGEAQLDFHSFDLSVLEFYRNDPRYGYTVDDVSGTIYLKDQHVESGSMLERDQVCLQTFGFAYDDQMNRSVAVYSRYLHDLSPEHQQIWESKRLPVRGKIHPDYYRSTVRAMFADHIPILTAFGMELKHINEMAERMGRPPLFRRTFELNERPANFTFLIRPTAKELNDFVLLLDQLMSDNINKAFFRNNVPTEDEVTRKDGRVEVRQRGTIAILESWLRSKVHPVDPKPLDDMIATFRKVRILRQTPAHNSVENTFNQEFFKEQRQIVLEAYTAVRTIRLLFANHPACQSYQIEKILYEGRIRDF